MNYAMRQAVLEDCNYHADPRVRALEEREHQPDFDEKNMVLHFDPPECTIQGCCSEPYSCTWELSHDVYGHTLDGCLDERMMAHYGRAIKLYTGGAEHPAFKLSWTGIWPMREKFHNEGMYHIVGPDGGLGPLGSGDQRACRQMEGFLNRMSGYAGPNGHPRIAIPARFVVCHTCDGRGTHVNPSIDCGGLTDDDWDRDEDFREHYFSGMYDQECNECGGKRVVPAPDWDDANPAHLALREHLIEEARGRADDWAERQAERRMGA